MTPTPDAKLLPCRAAFEKWSREYAFATDVALIKNADGMYIACASTAKQWMAWQAAWNTRSPTNCAGLVSALEQMQRVRRGPVPRGSDPTACLHYDRGWNDCLKHVAHRAEQEKDVNDGK